MAEIHTAHLMTLTLAVGTRQMIGATPNGNRRVGLTAGGRFDGERLRGSVLPGGADWTVARPDGATIADVRLVLETEDKALIGMTYRGIAPSEVIERLIRGDAVDPTAYYFRTSVVFETASTKYDWLNRIIAVGIGRRPPEGVVYEIFEIM